MRFCQHSSITGEHNFEAFADITNVKSSNSGSLNAKPVSDKTICLLIEGAPQFTNDYFFHLVDAFSNSEIAIAYSDFEVKSDFQILDDHIRPPNWSPERFLSTDFLGPALAIDFEKFHDDFHARDKSRTAILLECISQNYELALIPEIGYVISPSEARVQDDNRGLEIERFLAEQRPGSSVKTTSSQWLEISNKGLAPELISIIIPTRGSKKSRRGNEMIIECISSLLTQSLGKSKLEVLVVYDTDCNTDYLKKVQKLQSEKVAIKCIGYEPPFNFSKKCNLGASHASGEVVVFLNDDTWWRSSDALLELAGSAMIDGIGAVGAKLFFENGRLQHAGYIFRGGFVSHAYFKDVDGYGPFADLIATHEVVGVTGACLAQKRSIWESVGRWDEALPAAYNDVDYCFRIRDSGLSILQVNSARLFHYESITRNPTVRPEETKLILDRWQHVFGEEQFFRQAATVPEARYLRGTFFQEYFRYVQTTYKHQGVSGVLMLFVNKIKKFMN